ncbi:hypothetical protein JYB64_17040 [Algoriphagus aestuarii]|nr:hypothetical protein [Algoriphagus aestuarii]
MTATACSGDAFSVTPANSTNGVVPAGTTYSWSAPAVTGGITGGAAGTGATAITGTLTNPTNTAQTATYTVTPTSGSCPGTPFTVTVTVSPKPAISNMTVNLCTGGSFDITPTNGTNGIIPAGTTYTWTAPSVNGGITGGLAGSGSSIIGTLSNPTNTPQTATYEVTPTSGSCIGSVFTITIIVDPITSITTQPDTTNRVECFGDGFNPLTVVAEGGDLKYQWYSVPTQTNSGGTAVSGGTFATFTPPSTTEGISYYYVVVTGNCGIETSTVSGEFRVNPPKTVIDIPPSTSNESKCLGEAFPTLSVLASGEGSVSYQWYKNTTASNSGGTLISGAISEDYTPLSDEVGTFYYYALASSNCGTVPTAVSGAFTVYAPPTVSNPATASICSSESPNISLTASVPSNFSWTIGTITGGITGASAGSGATINQTLTNPSNTTAGTVEYIVTPTSTTGSCTGAPYTITVTVNPTPVVTNSATAITCSGTGPNISLTASVPSSFSWTIGTITGAITGASAGSGATINQTLTNPSNTTAGTVQYIVTPTSTTGSCPGAPYTITVTVNPQPVVTNSTLTQTICSGGSTTAVTLTSGIAGTTFTWTASATAGVSGFTASGSGPIPVETISTTGTTQGTVTYVITPTANGCPGPTKNYTVLVNPQPTVTNSSLSQTICSGGSTTAVTPTSGVAGTTFTWTATATAGVSGFTPSGTGPIPVQTISTTGTTQGTVTYVITPTANGCTGPTKNYTVLVNPLATVGPTTVFTNNFPSVCITSPAITNFSRPTTGVTGIGTPTGLPPGISAVFNTITKNIDFSGSVTTGTPTGLYTYSIPLTGTCITGPATGTIDVTPVYDITSVSSVSATSIGGLATVTFYADPTKMLDGTYNITYQIKQGSGGFTTVGPVNATVINGKGTFTTNPINSNVDTYTVQILSIKKSTDVCTVTLSSPPTTYFGVCSAVFTTGTNTFYVPANVYSVTIEVYGGGGGGNNGGGGGGGYSIRQNIPVTPGEPLGVFIGAGGANNGSDGGVSYVTRDSNIANQLTNSLVLANGGKGSPSSGNAQGGTFDPRYSGSNGNPATGNTGGKAGGPLGGAAGGDGVNGSSPGGGGGKKQGTKGVGGSGLVIISYSCPDADNTDCIKVIDDGSKSGTTVLELTNITGSNSSVCKWNAPEGLTEFTVYVGSAGGGGGGGEGSGGGGSGSLIRQTFTSTNPYGLPAGTSFNATIGLGGPGATGVNLPGGVGAASTFTGSINGSPINISVPGGGGGGSRSSNAGGNGSSGGGGGASPDPAKSFGQGGNAIPITYTGTNVTTYQGNIGGTGDYSAPQNSVAGGGGGGLVPWSNGNDGQNGKAAGNGQGEGGRGGDGITLTLGDSLRYYGAGGGGIGRFFEGTDKIGLGGSAGGIRIGGSGNLSGTNPIGSPGKNKTGSGGGAGYNGGGRGGDGVVYIVFQILKILEVEYQSFEAKYNEDNRSGILEWTTSQEWENDRFEIERATNGDLTSWKKIGEVKGQGYKDTPTSYSFEDLDLPASGGDIFYRLKQIDIDGTHAYSVTRSIQVPSLNGKSRWIVYPNPSSSGNYVSVDLLDRSKYRDEHILIRVSDVKGVFQSYSVTTIEEVSEAVNYYLESAAPGIHIVQLIWGENTEQLKIIRK